MTTNETPKPDGRTPGLITAELRERKSNGVAYDIWRTFAIPHGTAPTTKSGRTVWSATYDAPVRIPVRGHVTIRVHGADVPALVFEYADRIPAVRSRVIDAERLPPALTGLGVPVGVVRERMPSSFQAFADEFEGYEALADELWVQLNPGSDPVVVQMKLKKLAPDDMCRDFGDGAYYVYGVTRFAVQVAAPPAPPAPPKTDKEKALMV